MNNNNQEEQNEYNNSDNLNCWRIGNNILYQTKNSSTCYRNKIFTNKNISELRDMFTQMDSTGVGDQYREFVELKGKSLLTI